MGPDRTSHRRWTASAASIDGAAPPRELAWPGRVALLVGVVGSVSAHVLSLSFTDTSSPGAMSWTAGVALASLAATGAGAELTVSTATSPSRQLFRSRTARAAGLALALASAVLVVTLVLLEPFQGVLAGGRLGAEVIAGAGSVGVLVGCLASCGAAFSAARRASAVERASLDAL